jgi:hypothetical protein
VIVAEEGHRALYVVVTTKKRGVHSGQIRRWGGTAQRAQIWRHSVGVQQKDLFDSDPAQQMGAFAAQVEAGQQTGGGRGTHDLIAVGQVSDTRRSIRHRPEIVAVRGLDVAGVQSNPDLQQVSKFSRFAL